jgi:hypothetical protein
MEAETTAIAVTSNRHRVPVLSITECVHDVNVARLISRDKLPESFSMIAPVQT